MENDVPNVLEDEEPKFEMTPEEATSLDGSSGSPGVFNRKKVMIFICAALAVFVMLGVIINTVKTSKKSKSAAVDEFASSRSNSSFLTSLRDSALRENVRGTEAVFNPGSVEQPNVEEPLLPPVSFNKLNETQPVKNTPAPVYQQPPPQQQQYQATPPPQQTDTHFRSSLVPQIQGSLFSRNTAAGQSGQNSQQQNVSASPYDDYLNQLNSRASSYQASGAQAQDNRQNNQQTNQSFFESSNPSGAVYEGRYLGENALWIGTMIPGILETAINTDLPGHVLARVTQNVYDSQTGKYLLIPQGTLLVARYNNSVSYAQSRVQIVWDTLIRPDGFQIDLDGANGVDRAGMSGQEADYHENWFEYVKAAGIISLFSYANAKFVETANKFSTSSESASNIAQANQQFFNQLGSSLVSRAMGVQPTLTVENGTLINIMLNKTLYLPSIAGFAPVKKYILE
jgi:type IV secretion system protein VirB10